MPNYTVGMSVRSYDWRKTKGADGGKRWSKKFGRRQMRTTAKRELQGDLYQLSISTNANQDA